MTELDLLAPLAQLIPHDLSVALVVAFTVASGVTNLFATPAKPEPGACWTAWVWWLAYRLCEMVAIVGARAKQRPELAAQVLGVVEGLTRHPAGQMLDTDLRKLVDVADKLRK